jgi:hypothetical protein
VRAGRRCLLAQLCAHLSRPRSRDPGSATASVEQQHSSEPSHTPVTGSLHHPCRYWSAPELNEVLHLQCKGIEAIEGLQVGACA